MKITTLTLLMSALLGAGGAWAAGDGHAQAAIQVAQAAPAGPMEMVDGEVRKIDPENKKITLKHGEIKNLGMPSMTMVFQVKDPAMLGKLKPGDKVRFMAEKADGAISVTHIEPAK